MRFHQPTISYVTRRTAEGLAKRDIIRCLKRFLAREVYRRVMADHRAREGRSESEVLTYRGVNALAESVIGLFKTEVIRHRGPWRNIDAVEYATLEWVDWFNHRRLLRPIGDVPPAELETAYHRQQTESATAA